MIDRILFSGRSLSATKAALDAYSERGKVHARNVANAETPGYRAQEVRFEQDLRLALRTATDSALARTDERHLGGADELPDGRVVARNAEDLWTASGRNDVEIDREMADIARNTLRYTVAAEMVRKAYEGMRKAIHGRPVG